MLPLQAVPVVTNLDGSLLPLQRPSFMMRSLEDHFSDSAIIRKLCISRLKQANARHKELFYNRIKCKSKLSETHSSVDVLPPRRLWSRFRNKNRKLRSNEDQNLVGLVRATEISRQMAVRGRVPTTCCHLRLLLPFFPFVCTTQERRGVARRARIHFTLLAPRR
jgi:hypothetical protein